jgi:ornithine cyclodeaminase/alanine dehydrogenase-like protein (mu-crystallin family)
MFPKTLDWEAAQDNPLVSADVVALQLSAVAAKLLMVEGELTMATVKVGLVGCGFVAHLHMYAYKRVYGVDVEVKAVAARGDHVVDFASRTRFRPRIEAFAI